MKSANQVDKPFIMLMYMHSLFLGWEYFTHGGFMGPPPTPPPPPRPGWKKCLKGPFLGMQQVPLSGPNHGGEQSSQERLHPPPSHKFLDSPKDLSFRFCRALALHCFERLSMGAS